MTDPSVAALADGVYRSVVLLWRRLRREDDHGALGAPQLSTLTTLVSNGPMTLGSLAEAEHVRPPTMSRRVAELERAGMVLRSPSPDDGRSIRIRHTTGAIRALQAGRAARVAALGSRLALLDPDERETLERALGILDRLAATPGSES